MKTETFTAGTSGTFTVPFGVTQLTITMWGGGGSGANGVNTPPDYLGHGGGGGAVITNWLYSCSPYDAISYGVGLGGAAVTEGTNGNNGEITTFGNLIAYYGYGGVMNNITVPTLGQGGNLIAGGHTVLGGGSGTPGSNGDTLDHGDGAILYGGGGAGYAGANDGGDSYSSTNGTGVAKASGGGASYGAGGNGGNGSSGTDGINGGGGGGAYGNIGNGQLSGAGGGGGLTVTYADAGLFTFMG